MNFRSSMTQLKMHKVKISRGPGGWIPFGASPGRCHKTCNAVWLSRDRQRGSR